MTTIDVYSLTGTKKSKIILPKEIFGAKINEPLMAQAVRVFLSNQRKSHAKTKTRGEVTGSGRKIWRQKGTGRARHGDRYAPIFVGGGVAHGPTGEENWKRELPKKMRKQALASALTAKLKDNQIMVIDGLETIKGRTKEMIEILEKIFKEKIKKVLLVLSEKKEKNKENIIRAARNIPRVKIAQISSLNTYEILSGGKILFTKEAIKSLEEEWKKPKF